MATTSGTRAAPQNKRPSSVSGAPSPPANSIARGATARSALPPRVTSPLNGAAPRRASTLKASPTPSPAVNGETKESLAISLKLEMDQKEQLLIQLQNKDQTIANLTTEIDNITSALTAAETRVNELYADQGRMEDEMAARIELVEKLRSQVRELEKEKRDVLRRYNEQTATFDAERQAFYDNEQHLKSRIQSLMQARKQPDTPTLNHEAENETDVEEDEYALQDKPSQAPAQDVNDNEAEPAEMTSLRLELSTLSTSYSSMQSTLMLLQTQLLDLKRVNHELQEENESFMILLREKTLSGQYDVMKQVGGASPDNTEDEDEDAESNVGSFRSTNKPTLPSVQEAPEERLEQEQDPELTVPSDDPDSPRPARYQSRPSRKRSTSHSPSSSAPRGESLADLPITGPGLDLAAELGRAENKDILDGVAVDEGSMLNAKAKRNKKHTFDRKVSASSEPTSDIDALRNEVKSLKDANKALSLYASKIIDRIIAQEGFEHVLAVDYEKPTTPAEPPTAKGIAPALASPGLLSPNPAKKERPQSMSFRGSWTSASEKGSDRAVSPAPPQSGPSTPNPNAKRRSMSFDWRSFSVVFGGNEKKEAPNLRPLTLKPGANAIVSGARKLETQEDEEDRRERDRLHATMKLMGIQPQANPSSSSPVVSTPIARSFTAPGPADAPPNFSRFSFFRKSSAANSETSSVHSAQSMQSNQGHGNLTQEALEQAEAESKLAALDAHEQALSLEIARGATGGFTEIAPRGTEERRSRRSRRSNDNGSGSGSTVWSAGMSGADEEVMS